MAAALEAARAEAAAAVAAAAVAVAVAEVPVAAPGAEAAAEAAAAVAAAVAVAPEAARGSAVAEATPAPDSPSSPVPAADCAHSPSQLGYCLCTCFYRCPARHQPQSAWRRGPVLSVGRASWSPDQSLWLTETAPPTGARSAPTTCARRISGWWSVRYDGKTVQKSPVLP